MEPLLFETIRDHYFGTTRAEKIRATRIGIAGAGGLGSNCAVALVRCGFENLTIADFDTVEPLNLNRQVYFEDQIGMSKTEALKQNLQRINPACRVKTFQIKIDARNADSVFGSCNVVVEAFDDPASKAMLAQRFGPAAVFFVCASGIAGFGDADRISTRFLNATCVVVGDLTTAAGPKTPPCAPCVTLAAAKQADAVLNWVCTVS